MQIALRIAAAVSIAALAACGGSSGNAALSKSFNYGSPQAPSSNEQTAASSAQDSLSATASFSTAPDATKGLAVVAFADTVAGAAFGNATFGIKPPGSSREIARAIDSFDTSACATVNGNTVTFKGCSDSSAGYTFTLDGSITSTANSVSWNMTGAFSGTSNNVTINLNMHQTGAFAVTATKVTGNSVSDFNINASGQGQSVSAGLATAAIVDLTYQTSPSYCVTSGTVEVKRVWTQKPNGATGAQFADAGVKINWTGCNAVQVAHST